MATSVAPRQRSLLSQRQSRFLTRALVFLVVAAAVVMVLIPLYWMLTTALKSDREIYEQFNYIPRQPTLEQFATVMFKKQLLVSIKNSLIVALSSTLLAVTFSALAAFSVVRFRYRGRDTLARLILFKYLLPTSLLYIPLLIVITGAGLANSLQSLIVSYLTFSIPFCTWLLMGYFRGIPADLEEQAMVDGCSRLGALFRVLLPLSAPGVIASTIFTFTHAWNEFLLALVFVSSEDKLTVPIRLAGLMNSDQYIWGQLMAGALVAALPVLILYSLAQQFVVEGLAAGAVKG